MRQLLKNIKSTHCLSARGSVLKIILFVEVCKLCLMKNALKQMLGISCVLSYFFVVVVHENVCTFLSLSFMKYNVLKIVLACLF